MEDNFNQNDFEEFLQDQVRNHRMYPADAVWREIDKKLHGDKRWPALTIAASVLLSATVLICVYFTPKPNIFSIQPAHVNTSTPQASQNNILTDLTSQGAFAREKSAFPGPQPNRSAITSADLSTVNSKYDAGIIATPEVAMNRTAVPEPNFKSPGAARLSISASRTAVKQAQEKENNPSIVITGPVSTPENNLLETTAKSTVANKTRSTAENSSGKDYNDKNMVDDFLKEHKTDVALHTIDKKVTAKHKFSYQLYFAPSISYRKLLEDNSMVKTNNNGGPVGLNYVTDVNKVVRHKPGTGIEIGVSFMYNLSNSVRVKTGIQFNKRQYSIEAYRSSTELASIALVAGNRIDTINSLSVYRNNNGYYSAELVNRYYQFSMPIGVEWEILGNKKIHLNVAGTIQPTYLFNRNAYLLSTNFKNYTENPGMVRQWNLNSNVEAFISFKAGDFKWQLGPQLRYQPYSTFIPEYSIKEHLMDYGIKLGVSQLIK